VVEVGAWHGRSTRALANVKGVVYAVDHWKGSVGEARFDGIDPDAEFATFKKRTADLENLRIIRMDSVSAAKRFSKQVDMVFIDASHDEVSFRADVEAWLPKTRKILCGHDYCDMWPDVKKVVDELLGPVEVVGSIWIKRLT